jgi:hypothetical protein
VKKLAACILAVLYLVTSTGATIHTHYCMGKLRSAGLWSTGKDACATCGMEKKKGCCEDRHTTLKIDKQHNVPVVVLSLDNDAAHLPLSYSTNSQPELLFFTRARYSLVNSPPGKAFIPLYISNSIFRI